MLVLDVKGAIGVASDRYIALGLARARDERAALVVIKLNTPGGLVSSTRTIVQAILASPVPVAILVAPEGARAASAGTYMVYAAHVAAMTRGTHLGAATPISIGTPSTPSTPSRDKDAKESDAKDASERKTVNDAAAYLRSLAQLRGRNAEWADRAVRSAATLTAEEALRENVVDLLAGGVSDLLARVDGRSVATAAGERQLATKGARIVELPPDFRTNFLSVIGDPNLAFILLMLGIYGILFELWHPGAIFPGAVGGISLLIGLAALAILPIDYAALGLLLLGVALLVAEVFTPGVGILGISGLIAFVAGSLMLFDPGAVRGIDIRISWPIVAAVAAVTGAVLVFGLGAALRVRRRPVVTGIEQMIGSTGRVVEWQERTGTIRVHGEIWSARSAHSLSPGVLVRVAALDKLTAVVEPQREGGK